MFNLYVKYNKYDVFSTLYLFLWIKIDDCFNFACNNFLSMLFFASKSSLRVNNNIPAISFSMHHNEITVCQCLYKVDHPFSSILTDLETVAKR